MEFRARVHIAPGRGFLINPQPQNQGAAGNPGTGNTPIGIATRPLPGFHLPSNRIKLVLDSKDKHSMPGAIITIGLKNQRKENIAPRNQSGAEPGRFG